MAPGIVERTRRYQRRREQDYIISINKKIRSYGKVNNNNERSYQR